MYQARTSTNVTTSENSREPQPWLTLKSSGKYLSLKEGVRREEPDLAHQPLHVCVKLYHT